MSQKNIQTQWTNTQIKLSRLLTSEFSGPKGFESKRQANDYVRRLFVQYNDMMKKLDEIIKFDSCEYTYFEDLALDQNKTLVKILIQRFLFRIDKKLIVIG
jgi:hypothetical protein